MNTQRRLFRGRGGPNDRRLPKYNARRRRVNRTDEEKVPKYGPKQEPPQDDKQQPDNTNSNDNHVSLPSLVNSSQDEDNVVQLGAEKEGDHENHQVEDSLPQPQDQPKKDDGVALQQELDHLKKRIKNNRASFSLSKDGLSTPSSYQMNVLNAVKNCVDEWKGIVGHYRPDMDATVGRDTGQQIFELLQQALQCGPLAGAKPGYFKRCGSQVATMVHAFLFEIIATPCEASTTLHFTDKQVEAVETWKRAALEASSKANQPPSKSVLQMQKQACKVRQQKDNKIAKK